MGVGEEDPPQMPFCITPRPEDPKPWFYTACSVSRLAEVELCLHRPKKRGGGEASGSLDEKPAEVVGLVVRDTDGRRQCIGRFRPDRVGKVIRVGSVDKLHFYSSQPTTTGRRYLSDVCTPPPPSSSGYFCMEVVQTGILEWWFAGGDNYLAHGENKLELSWEIFQ